MNYVEWLDERRAAMAPAAGDDGVLLDLSRHGPLQWKGKVVVVGSARYVVGEQIGQGAAGLVFRLVNVRTNLCLLVLKLYRDTEQAAYGRQRALDHVSHHYRNGFFDTPWLINIELPGGGAQVQQALCSPELPASPTSALYNRAYELAARVLAVETAVDPSEQGALQELAEACLAVLELNPHHTLAISHLAGAMTRRGDHSQAALLAYKAVDDEPNCLDVWQVSIPQIARRSPFHVASDLYESMKTVFPYASALDEFAVDMYLRLGEPGKAEAIVDASADEKVRALAASVGEALRRRERAREHVSRAREIMWIDDFAGAARLLEAALQEYDEDPLIHFNLAFMYTQLQAYDDAREHLYAALPSCPLHLQLPITAHAAFLEVLRDNVDPALELLRSVADRVMERLMRGSELTDTLPSVALWVDGAQCVHMTFAVAAQLIRQAVERGSPDGVVDGRLHSLLGLYGFVSP